MLNRGSQEALRHSQERQSSPLRLYGAWWERVLTGDFGFSQSLNRPVRDLLAERAPATIELTAWGIAGAWMLAAFFALLPSPLSSIASGMAASLPAAAIAIVLFRLGWSARWMIALILFPRLHQYLRNLLEQTSAMPHVLLARAKGVRWPGLMLRHILMPARAQLIALAAVSINMAFGAAVAVEAICDIPGLGQLAWKAAAARDLTVLVMLTLVIALVTQISNLVADACTPALRRQA
jgi:peptide/nickel transport system permease protein